ncbi:MAG TPA: hypothetical protein VHY58_11350 [Streptosporangiaceae bacterium]|nr:hypothetical protein [Streptosporangiaceae bacterium]
MKWTHVALALWNAIVDWVRQESAAFTALVQAFIALGIAFTWWHWSNAQTGAVFGIVSALLAMFVRSQVTPVARTRQPKRVTAAVPPASPAPASPAPPRPPSPRSAPPAGPQGDYPGGSPDWPDPPTGPPSGPGTRPW